MIVELLSCVGCSRISDDRSWVPFCPRCKVTRVRQINPSFIILLRWFFTNPKHVTKLIIQDIRETYFEKTS